MRMNGSWHLYKPGERWRRPRRDMRVVVETETRVAVGFNIPVAEFLTERDLSRHRALQALGPDLLDSGFDPVEVHRRMALRSGDTVANVLLNQRVMAGVGNVFRSRSCFWLAWSHSQQSENCPNLNDSESSTRHERCWQRMFFPVR